MEKNEGDDDEKNSLLRTYVVAKYTQTSIVVVKINGLLRRNTSRTEETFFFLSRFLSSPSSHIPRFTFQSQTKPRNFFFFSLWI